MALFLTGSGIARISGSIAGHTFARNKSGDYVRNRTKPVNPRTSFQQVMRAIVAALAQYWRTQLTPEQRGAWENYAQAVGMKNRIGQTIHLTGFNHFIRTNSLVLKQTNALIKPGPTTLSLPAQDPTFAVAASAATQLLSITFDNTQTWAQSPNSFLALFMGRPKSITRTSFFGPWRWAGSIPGAGSPPTSPQTKTAPFTLVAGQKVWVYARAVQEDGRTSEPFRASCTIGA